MNVIKTQGLRKEFTTGFFRKKSVAVEGLDLSIEEGEIFGFLGPNGAGKTTTIKMLLGLIYPTAGDAFMFGKSIQDVTVRKEVGYLPEQPYFYDYLTAEEFLLFYGGLFDLHQSELKSNIRRLLDLVGLSGKEKTQLRKFSKGMLQRIGIAQAIINDPKLVILDEPMSGLDPLGRKEVRDIILHLKDRGKTIFFSSHILPDVEMISDRIGIIVKGRLLQTGKVDDLVQSMGTHSVEVTVEGLGENHLSNLEGPNSKVQKMVVNGNKALLIFGGEENVQKGIKYVIEEGGKIVSVSQQKRSLEEYFMNQVNQRNVP